MTVPEGRYALDLNNAVIADPYITGTPYLASKDEAEALAKELLPLLDGCAKWHLLALAREEEEHARECAEKGWLNGNTWEEFGVAPGNYAELIRLLAADVQGKHANVDWRSYATVVSENRDHSWHLLERLGDDTDGCDPAYEENYGGTD